MLLVGGCSHTPVALVVLHKHTHGDGFAAAVFERYVEEFAGVFKIGIERRWQFGEFRLHRYIYGQFRLRIVHHYIEILTCIAVLHKQHKQFALAIVAHLCIGRVGGVVHKGACGNLRHIFNVLVAFELGNDIVWHNALRCHKAILRVCYVAAVEHRIGGVLFLGKLIQHKVVYELACNGEPPVVECGLGPREAGVGCREIGCVVSLVIFKTRNACIAVVYVCYVVERWRIGSVAYIEEADTLAQIVAGVVEIGIVAFRRNL